MKEETIKLDWREKEGIEFHKLAILEKGVSGFCVRDNLETELIIPIPEENIIHCESMINCKKKYDIEDELIMKLTLENMERKTLRSLLEENTVMSGFQEYSISQKIEKAPVMINIKAYLNNHTIHFFQRMPWTRSEWQDFETGENLVQYRSRFAFWIER